VIDLTDTELVARARQGSAGAITEIVRRHQAAVRGFLRRLSGFAEDTDDLAQETFLTAFARLDTFRGEASLRSWLCGIAYRKASTQRRTDGRRSVREIVSTMPIQITPDMPAPERRLDVEAAFRSLSVEHRAVAALCLASDMSHSEAAAALGIPLGTLKSRVASARKILLAVLEDYR
jgi:RNA polymerase sigma-70 factor (ECF subfamily)